MDALQYSPVNQTNKRVKDPEKFELLLRHLPPAIKEEMFNYNPSEAIFASDLATFKAANGPFYGTNSIQKISQFGLLAYRVNKISLDELATLFITIGAIDEFYLNIRKNIVVEGKDASHAFSEEIQGVELPPLQIWRGQFDISRKAFMGEISENYSNKIEDIKFIYLKSFFSFNDDEWSLYRASLEKVTGTEKWYSLFSPIDKGCWSILYEDLCRTLRCFDEVKLYMEPNSFNKPPPIERKILVPSWSMLQKFIDVKAITQGRKAMTLVPVFGSLTPAEEFQLKQEDKIPIRLFPPLFNGKHSSLKNRVFLATPSNKWKNLEICSGYYSKLLLDTASALQWQEIDQNICAALLHIVGLLDEYAEGLDKDSKHYLDLFTLRQSLFTGFGIHSFPNNNSLYRSRPFEAEIFKDIFSTKYWKHEMLDLVIYDILRNPKFWKEKFNIELEDLPSELRSTCLHLQYLFNKTIPTLKTISNFDCMSGNIEISEVKILNSKFNKLSCDTAFVVNSSIKVIKSSNKVALKDCKLKGTKIDSAVGTLIYGSCLNGVKVKNKTQVSETMIVDSVIKKSTFKGNVILADCSLKNIQSDSITFLKQDPKKCPGIKAQTVDWQINVKKLHLSKFKADVVYIRADKCDAPVDFSFDQCQIKKFIVLGKGQPANDLIGQMSKSASEIGVVGYAFNDSSPTTKGCLLEINWSEPSDNLTRENGEDFNR